MLSLGNARGADEFRAWEGRLENRLKRLDISPEASHLRRRAEDRRDRDLAALRGRGVRPRRDPRRRRDRRGRHRQPEDDLGDPAPHRGRARGSRSAARSTSRAAASPSSTSSARPRASRPSPTRATRPRARSASWTRRSPRRGRCRCGATGPGAARGIEFASHSEELDWMRERGFPVNGDVSTHEDVEDGGRALPVVGGTPRVARLRDRRRRGQGRRAGASGASSGSPGASRAGRSPGSSRRSPRRRRSTGSSGTSGAPAGCCRSRCSSRCTSAG